MNVGNKVIYDLENPKMFVNFNKFHDFHFTHSNTFFWGVRGLQKTLKEVHDTKQIKNS
jgi:hypothetical protein